MSAKSLLIGFVAFFLLGLADSTTGLKSKELQGQESIRSQWRNSPHAGSMDTPEEAGRMNQPGCARCHTAQGYHREILSGLASAAPYPDPVGLTCITCHLEGSEAGRVGALRTGGSREACRRCHDEVVVNRPDDLSWCSQWGVFDGTGGREAPGRDYPASAHTDLESGCVSCHMAGAGEGLDPLAVGGHTFRVKTKGEAPAVLNGWPCQPCHAGMTMDRLEDSQARVRDLLDTLGALLPQKTHPTDPDATEPKYPSDRSLTAAQARASYNYWLVQKDGSLGVHNPQYTRALLEGSIEELR